MRNLKRRDLIKMGSLFLLGMVVLFGCSTTSNQSLEAPTSTNDFFQKPSPTIIISSPELALKDALTTIRGKYAITAPSQISTWEEHVLQPEILDNAEGYQFVSGNWQARVTYPQNVAPESIIYTVDIHNSQVGFEWVGLIDSSGKVEDVTTVTEAAPSTSTPTATPVWPTETAIPTATPLPTQTPIPTITPTATPTPNPCDAAEFITDVTIPDGSPFTPNTAFEKTWRLKNVGTCTWTDNYDLVFVNGNQMDGPNAVALSNSVKPGQSIDISVRLNAPASTGDYQGFWMLRNANNVLFGIGDDAKNPFWVSITVAREKGIYDYDFAISFCSANWRSEIGQISCNDTSRSSNGFVEFLSNPALENRHENEPALWVHPNEKQNGWIEGRYPAFAIQPGDIFETWVGCLEGYPSCSVTFYLSYETDDGRIHTLKKWEEIYDGNITKIEYDLSSLEGETVNLILGMRANTRNVADAQGFWFVPRIVRRKSFIEY